MSRKKQKAPVRNPIQVASLARYPRTQPHTNKRDKRAHEDKRWTRFKEEGLGMVTKREFEALVDNLVSEWQKVHLDRYTSDDPSMAALGYHAWGSQVNGAANDLEARLYELIDDVAAKLANGDYHQPSDRDVALAVDAIHGLQDEEYDFDTCITDWAKAHGLNAEHLAQRVHKALAIVNGEKPSFPR
jgi:hypothetical protein